MDVYIFRYFCIVIIMYVYTYYYFIYALKYSNTKSMLKALCTTDATFLLKLCFILKKFKLDYFSEIII